MACAQALGGLPVRHGFIHFRHPGEAAAQDHEESMCRTASCPLPVTQFEDCGGKAGGAPPSEDVCGVAPGTPSTTCPSQWCPGSPSAPCAESRQSATALLAARPRDRPAPFLSLLLPAWAMDLAAAAPAEDFDDLRSWYSESPCASPRVAVTAAWESSADVAHATGSEAECELWPTRCDDASWTVISGDSSCAPACGDSDPRLKTRTCWADLAEEEDDVSGVWPASGAASGTSSPCCSSWRIRVRWADMVEDADVASLAESLWGFASPVGDGEDVWQSGVCWADLADADNEASEVWPTDAEWSFESSSDTVEGPRKARARWAELFDDEDDAIDPWSTPHEIGSGSTCPGASPCAASCGGSCSRARWADMAEDLHDAASLWLASCDTAGGGPPARARRL